MAVEIQKNKASDCTEEPRRFFLVCETDCVSEVARNMRSRTNTRQRDTQARNVLNRDEIKGEENDEDLHEHTPPDPWSTPSTPRPALGVGHGGRCHIPIVGHEHEDDGWVLTNKPSRDISEVMIKEEHRDRWQHILHDDNDNGNDMESDSFIIPEQQAEWLVNAETRPLCIASCSTVFKLRCKCSYYSRAPISSEK